MVEHELTNEFIESLNPYARDKCIALHVAPSALLGVSCDYYVRLIDLTTNRTLTTQRWANSESSFPNVSSSTTYLDGKTNTDNMLAAAVTLGTSSPAANYATSFRFAGMKGFIGTYAQMDYIINTSKYKTTIYNILGKLGHTANYRSTATWSSSQYNATASWFWNSGSWNLNTKTSTNYYVLPFFAV